jgi:hypothetical protein
MHRLVPLLLISSALLWGVEWAPIERSELQAKTPVVEAGADAEALFWEVRLTDEPDGSTIQAVLSHYLRIKIYTDRGREKLGNHRFAVSRLGQDYRLASLSTMPPHRRASL